MTLLEVRGKKGSQVMGSLDLVGNPEGAAKVALVRGRYADAIENDRLFLGANQAAQAVSVALATTYTGLCLSNPLQSGKRLLIRSCNIALSVAPAGIASLHLIGGQSASTDVTHTAAVTPRSCRLGSSAAPVAKVDSQATIPTPVYLMPLGSGFTAGALYATTPNVIDLDGLFAVDPGGFIAIGALTAVTGFFGFAWEEIDL